MENMYAELPLSLVDAPSNNRFWISNFSRLNDFKNRKCSLSFTGLNWQSFTL